jgi:hypothetical protein
MSSAVVSHDPLNLLRATISAKKPLILLDKSGQTEVDAVIKASYISLLADPTAVEETADPLRLVLAADTPTRFTTQLNDSGTTYTLAQLAYVYTSQGSSAAEYMKNASVGGVGVHVPTGVGSAGVPGGAENAFRPVTLIDRRVVLEYLLGGQAPAGRILVLGSKPEDQRGSQRFPGITVDLIRVDPLADFEGSLPAAHNPDLATLLAPTDAPHDPSQPLQPTSQSTTGKRKAYQINQTDVEEVKKVSRRSV